MMQPGQAGDAAAYGGAPSGYTYGAPSSPASISALVAGVRSTVIASTVFAFLTL